MNDVDSLITDHVWRASNVRGQDRQVCAYLNCRRPVAEHERSVDADLRARYGRRRP